VVTRQVVLAGAWVNVTLPTCRASSSTPCCPVYFIGLRLARGLVTRRTRRAAMATKQQDERQGNKGEYGDRDSSAASHSVC
jgi:hypothetical protein